MAAVGSQNESKRSILLPDDPCRRSPFPKREGTPRGQQKKAISSVPVCESKKREV
jgi:hypothetical protein